MRNALKLNLLVLLLLSLIMIGCSDPDDDEGIIGTGLILNGTVTEIGQLASNRLQIKSSTGELSTALIDDTGRYQSDAVIGAPPYLLRVDLGNDAYRYGIAFDDERANLHSYTDVILRNWFNNDNGDIDLSFDAAAIATPLPSRAQFNTNAAEFFDLARLVLEEYGITGSELLTADYDSTNSLTSNGAASNGAASNGATSIDQYLKLNPMLIQEDKISLVITDPKTNKQSSTRSDFSVFELATSPDTQIPETPQSVRALPSASNEIVVVWEPSSDNRGVIGYDIYRDGSPIATTPYPVYLDNDTALIANTVYSYQVVAIDSSDNPSAISQVATGTTLAEPDTTEPPMPVQLTVTPFLGRMELLWGQTNIGDVVSFDIYRGRGDNEPEYFKSVISTIMTDVSVFSGIQYCYQVVAVDASGNESDRSSENCQTAEGLEVKSANTSVVSTVPPFAGLTIPDVVSIECVNQWEQYTVTAAMQVGAGCYVVNENIVVESGGGLNLSPGVVLKFSAGTQLLVKKGGSLSAVGVPENPVLFTALDPTPGFWSGVVYEASNSSKNQLVNAVVEYAGGGINQAAVAVLARPNEISRLELSGSVIRDCVGSGVLAAHGFAKLVKLDGSVITACDAPLVISTATLNGVTQRNDFTGNRDNWIDIGDAFINEDLQLIDFGVPYVASGVRVESASLTILAGVEMQFRRSADLSVGDGGALVAEGSVDRRIRLTGTTQTAGHWAGVNVLGSVAMEFVDIEYTGADHSSGTEKGGLVLYSSASGQVQDIELADSSSYAINVINSLSAGFRIGGITLQRTAKALRLPLSSAGVFGEGAILSDDPSHLVEMYHSAPGGVMSGDVNVKDVGIPFYLVNSLEWKSGSFRVSPHVTIYVKNDVKILIRATTFIDFAGTEDMPISILGQSKIAGSWAGIEVDSNSSLNRIEHTTIAYAGGGEGVSAAVRLICTPSGSLSISNSNILESAGWGVISNDNPGCNLDLGENLIFAGNRLGDIGLEN